MMTITPFGQALRTFRDKAALYAAYPGLAEGWHPEAHPGTAPLGSDLSNNPAGFLLMIAHPKQGLGLTKAVGAAVAFEHSTGLIHVLAEHLSYSEAQRRWIQ